MVGPPVGTGDPRLDAEPAVRQLDLHVVERSAGGYLDAAECTVVLGLSVDDHLLSGRDALDESRRALGSVTWTSTS